MALNYITDKETNESIFYISSTMKPIGMVLSGDDDPEEFMEWCKERGINLKLVDDYEFQTTYFKWKEEKGDFN